jgi:hypothetical protein
LTVQGGKLPWWREEFKEFRSSRRRSQESGARIQEPGDQGFGDAWNKKRHGSK